MKIAAFTAAPDLVGRRVRISWSFEPEAGETLADVPHVSVRRKLRDFEFPLPDASDPTLVYDSNLFPPVPVPGAVSVTDLDAWEVVAPGSRTAYEPISVATAFAGRLIETLRVTVGTTYDESGGAVRQHVEVLDLGGAPGALLPGTVYYYQIFNNGILPGDASQYRATALVSDSYGTNRALYDSLPAIYRRHDVVARPATPGADTVPEAAPLSGQLRRLIDLFGIALDSLRGSADGLRSLHDLDNVDARFLPLLASWIGWDLVGDVAAPLLRNEVKAASRLGRVVGTIPGLRVLTSQYTGWFTQVAEFGEYITRANQPARRAVMAVAERGGSWSGADDLAFALGLAAPNAEAAGSGGAPAVLVGTKTGPFALRPGMVLSIAVDGMAPADVRVGAADFANPGAATVDEVAAVIGRGLAEASVDTAGGRLRITSRSTGAESTLSIVQAPNSLVSIEHAPAGRLSPTVDAEGRQRLFYEAWEAPPATSASADAESATGSNAVRRIRYKTLEGAVWRDSHPLFEIRPDQQGDPAAAVLSDDRVLAAWLDRPQTAASRLRLAVGTSRSELPARIAGLRVEPFRLIPNSVLTLIGSFTGTNQFTVRQGDYADVTRATAAEVVAAMNAQITQVKASRANNGSIALETLQTGSRARVAVDFRHSTAARALGLERRNAAGASGSWDETIDWSGVLDLPSVLPGRYAELCAAVEPAGGARIVFSIYAERSWRIAEVRWDERVLVSTASGLAVRSADGSAWKTLGLADGLPAADVRGAVVDADGTVWMATSAGVAMRLLAGATRTLTTTDGLPSNDVRAIALAQDGSVWIATAAGVLVRKADGTSLLLNSASGLPSLNVRGVAVARDGSAWIATDNGLAMRTRDGVMTVFKTVDGFPSNDVRAVVIGADIAASSGTPIDNVAVATGAGVIVGSTVRFTPFAVAAGLPHNDVRAVAWDNAGALWVATARGVSAITPSLDVSVVLDSGSGLSSDDARAVAIAPDGAVWIGTASGVDVRQPDGTVAHVAAAGLPAGPVRSIAGFCSPVRELASTAAASREPCVVVDEQLRTWVIWSERSAAAEDDTWSLIARLFMPATATRSAPIAITTPPAGARAADRMPSAIRVAGGLRVFFSSDRDGGVGLWSAAVTLAGVASAAAALPQQPSSDTAPAPLAVGGETWLVFRSDVSVSLAQLSPLTPAEPGRRLPDAGTLRRMAGTTTMVPADIARARLTRTFGDLLSYTPQKPLGPPVEAPLIDDELYTRGTVGLYVSRGPIGDPITPSEIGRLRELLARLLPINVRAVVVIVPTLDVEAVYPAGSDIGESFRDDYPFPDVLGPVTDTTAVSLLDWTQLHANVQADVAVKPGDTTTLRRRTWFPPAR